jgi:2-haloacid dehalogenase
MVTLTNSPPTPDSQSPLEHAGLHKYFERQFNIQTARAYKPAPVVYHMVAQELGVEPVDCCMVASHVWDTLGGQSVGMASGLITRPGNALLPIPGLPQPHAIGADSGAGGRDDSLVALLKGCRWPLPVSLPPSLYNSSRGYL